MKYKLIALDVSGVLIDQDNIWMQVHDVFGTLKEGRKLTEKYLHTDYARLEKEVADKLWGGKDATKYYALINSQPEIPGIEEFFSYIDQQGLKKVLISASSKDSSRRIDEKYGVDEIYANELVINDNTVTGDFVGTIGQGRAEKPQALKDACEKYGVALSEAIYVGDNETDVEAAKIAGLSIAFNPKSEELLAACDYAVGEKDLRSLIEILEAH